MARLEEQVVALGGRMHWARDANEANRIVTDLVHATGPAGVGGCRPNVSVVIGWAALGTEDYLPLAPVFGTRRSSQAVGRSLAAVRSRMPRLWFLRTPYVPLTTTNDRNRQSAVARSGRASMQVNVVIDDRPQVFTNVDCDSQG